MKVNRGRAAIAGVAGTATMTVAGVWIPGMNPAEMLAGPMGGSMAVGSVAHFMIGVTLAGIYAAISDTLPGPAVVRGALYSVAPWLLAQVLVIPLMGRPLFSGSLSMALGSLLGHLVYGGVVGALYGNPSPAPPHAVA